MGTGGSVGRLKENERIPGNWQRNGAHSSIGGYQDDVFLFTLHPVWRGIRILRGVVENKSDGRRGRGMNRPGMGCPIFAGKHCIEI